jgi:hypothetical protein
MNKQQGLAPAGPQEGFMIKLEDVHQAMNNPQVQEVAKDLHFDYMMAGLDGVERNPARLRELVVARFESYRKIGIVKEPVTEEQLLATERIFQTKVESGQAWTQ